MEKRPSANSKSGGKTNSKYKIGSHNCFSVFAINFLTINFFAFHHNCPFQPAHQPVRYINYEFSWQYLCACYLLLTYFEVCCTYSFTSIPQIEQEKKIKIFIIIHTDKKKIIIINEWRENICVPYLHLSIRLYRN